MLRGLKDAYLQSLGGLQWEAPLVREIIKLHMRNTNDTSTYKSTFETILRLVAPNLNTIYNSVGQQNLRSNLVFTSYPEVYINDLVLFFMSSLFPESGPWLKRRFVTPAGVEIDSSKMDIRTVQFADDFINLLRYWLKKAGFYEASEEGMHSFFNLGNTALQALQTQNEFNVIHVPISRLALILDSAGRIAGLGEIFVYEDWEIRKNYGDAGLAYFAQDPRNPNYFVGGQPFGFGQGTAMGSEGILDPVGVPRTGFNETKIRQVLKVWLPNRSWMDFPHNPNFYPEMGYICFNVALKTNRLLDVELFPEMPFGVAQDKRPMGEKYGRGLGHRILADCSVLNEKKAQELRGMGLASGPPTLLRGGKGFIDRKRNNVRPNEIMHVDASTEVSVMADYGRFYQTNRSQYEEELLFLREATGRDRMEVQLADRMTLGEYTQRQDVAWSLYLAVAGRIQRQMAQPIIANLANWLFVTGRMPEIPGSIANGAVMFEVEPYSAFSYSQDSELGRKLVRALAPIQEHIAAQPELLDNINMDAFLRSSMGNFELSRFVPSRKEVEAQRDIRMQREIAIKQAGQLTPEQRAEESVAQEQATQGLEQSAGEYVAVGG